MHLNDILQAYCDLDFELDRLNKMTKPKTDYETRLSEVQNDFAHLSQAILIKSDFDNYTSHLDKINSTESQLHSLGDKLIEYLIPLKGKSLKYNYTSSKYDNVNSTYLFNLDDNELTYQRIQ